jgi:hypothetical protein
METDFSYEQDIAPYASKFFGEVQQSRSLSPQAKQRLQDQVFTGTVELAKLKNDLVQDKDEQVLRRQRIEAGSLDLEEARVRRDMRQRNMAGAGNANMELDALVSANVDPTTKKQAYAEWGFKNAGLLAADPDLAAKYRLGGSAIPDPPKSMFTVQDQINMFKQLPPEVAQYVLETGDVATLGQALGAIEQTEQQAKEIQRLRRSEDAQSNRILTGILGKPLKTREPLPDEDENALALDEESLVNAKVIVRSLGSPEEQQAFQAADDRSKLTMVNEIRARELSAIAERVTGASGPPAVDVSSMVRGSRIDIGSTGK